MINQVYRLEAPGHIVKQSVEEKISPEYIVVRPTHMSICHADQRYYTGARDKKILDEKLPMALIHEAVGEVEFDLQGEFPKGTRVILILNTPFDQSDTVAENYLKTSKFRSSGYDGFMQEYVLIRRDRVVVLPPEIDPEMAAFSELVSVAMHAIDRVLGHVVNKEMATYGIWGDGNLGYITSLLLSLKYPEAKIVALGKNAPKLNYFSFVTETHLITEIPSDFTIDCAFECVGGRGSEKALAQIVDCINPNGVIGLMGVTEEPCEVNTRMTLERGLTLIGSSRSGVEDFENVVKFYQEFPEGVERLKNLIGLSREVSTIEDVQACFEDELSNSWGKAVMTWQL